MASQSNPVTLLRCLSIQQPLAWAVCTGAKTVENRSWGTEYRGQIAIHAGADKQPVNGLVQRFAKEKLRPAFFSWGAIIGVAKLVNVVEMDPELETNPSASGPTCWLLADGLLLPNPVPSRGKLKLYTLSESESEAVQRQLPALRASPLTAEANKWAGALQADPFSLSVNRGRSYGSLAWYDDAIRNYDEAIRLEPTCAEAILFRAMAYLYGKRDALGGIGDCDLPITIDPGDARAFMIRSEAYRLLGNQAKAEADRAEAGALDLEILDDWEEAEW
jgi:hypothetical protein